MPKKKEVRFSDNIILSTPKRMHTPNLSQGKNLPKILDLDEIPQRLSDADSSLGTSSIKSEDFLNTALISDTPTCTREQNEKARSVLKGYESRRLELTSVSPLFLRGSENDLLLPDNSPTQLEFLLSNLEFVRTISCQLLGQAVTSLATSIFSLNSKKSQLFIPLIDTGDDETDPKERSLKLSDERLMPGQSTNMALKLQLKAKAELKLKNSIRKFKLMTSKEVEEVGKENVSPECGLKSILSSRSSSPLNSLPDGKLPIATTTPEIIWGCIKPGKTTSNDFVVRNRSSSRLGIQLTISNPSFQLSGEGFEFNFSSVMKLVLHPQESRALTVFFTPTTLGASVGCLNFTSTDPNHKQTVKQYLKLYGYGGYGKITFHKIIKDTTYKFLLSLGNIDDQRELKQNFVLKNDGSLSTFAYFQFTSNGLYSFSKLHISPKSVVLLPGEEIKVTVTLSVLKKDYNFVKSIISSCVINIGKLQVVHGTEVDRARLRRVSLKALEENKDVSSFVLNLIEKFPGEVILNDLNQFKETISSMDKIVKLLNKEEITITFEQFLGNSTSSQFLDGTVGFQNLCKKTNLDVVQDASYRLNCHVEPKKIILALPGKNRDMILLTNNNNKKLYFEVNSLPGGLYLKPKDGTINPGETVFISLVYRLAYTDKTVFKVRVLVDNSVSYEVDVKVVFCI